MFIFIPEGISVLGSDLHDSFANLKEIPLKEVFISDFYIAKYPTTNIQYFNFLIDTKTPYPNSLGKIINNTPEVVEKTPNFPVTNISWELAQTYCNWLSNKINRNVVLPTEAEWEKAARGGDNRIWSWGNEFIPNMCTSQENLNQICDVHLFEKGASPYGCLHMSGNVWEWCEDYWHSDSHSYTGHFNPVNVIPAERRVVKGGSAFCTKEIIRPACRDWTNTINQGGGDDGFRVAIREWR